MCNLLSRRARADKLQIFPVMRFVPGQFSTTTNGKQNIPNRTIRASAWYLGGAVILLPYSSGLSSAVLDVPLLLSVIQPYLHPGNFLHA
jgi:hypothetical protein